ncbi:hypothetical protein J6590_027467 [Homalodisca vitripennis]|nr:hypothetical protein J6590_027467 [Homalodisca vitripennis]
MIRALVTTEKAVIRPGYVCLWLYRRRRTDGQVVGVRQRVLPFPCRRVKTLDGQFPSFTSRGPTTKDGQRPSARHDIDVVEYIADRSQSHSNLLHILFSIF